MSLGGTGVEGMRASLKNPAEVILKPWTPSSQHYPNSVIDENIFTKNNVTQAKEINLDVYT